MKPALPFATAARVALVFGLAAAIPAPAAETVSGYTVVSFSLLAGFKLPVSTTEPLAKDVTPPDVLAHVPDAVKRLDGKKVLITGFMLPTKLEAGFATEFFLFSSPAYCCYGIVPAANEWVQVRMRKEGLPAVQHVPLPVAGRLRIRPRWDSGFLTGLYELEGDGLLKPKS